MQHPYDLKLEDRYSYDKATDTHDLWVLFTDKPHAPPPNKTAARTEFRLQDNDYKPDTGLHMMDCDLFIVPGTVACITQVFGTGPMAMIIVDKDGTITDRGHQLIVKDMYGKWFNMKCAFNPATGVGRVWINDNLVYTRQYKKGGSGWYFKNGAYNNGLPSGAVTSVHFRNISLWTM